MSEHTDAARLEATRDAIRTGTAPRPRVEGEAVRQPRLSAEQEELKRWTGMRVTDVRQKQWNLVLLFARRILSDKEALTAEVERLTKQKEALREAGEWFLYCVEGEQILAIPDEGQRATFAAALSLPTPAPEATE